MRFSAPYWLAAGFFACAMLLWMWRRCDARRQAALAKFVAAHLRARLTRSVSIAGRRTQRGLYLAALALLFVALAGPQVGYRWEQVSRRGNEIVFAIDTSRSMLTPDVKPDRLTRAKLAIDDFAKLLDGDAMGIVAFAGSAFLVCPITLDYGAFHESLSSIDTTTIPRGGTNISSAIEEARAALRRRPGSDKILILVTDGEDLEGSALTAARTAAQQDGLRIYTVGVGTPGGDLIPLPAEQGGGYVKDDSGAFVRSRLDEAALKSIAAAAGGIYVPLGAQGEGLEAVFQSIFGAVGKHDLAFRRQKVYIERYQWPLGASLALLLASQLVGTRRRAGAHRRAPDPLGRGRAVDPRRADRPRRAAGIARRPATAGIAALSGTLLVPIPMHATRAAGADSPAGTVAAASADSGASNVGAASADGEDAHPTKPILEFNSGTAAYRAGQYSQAAHAFHQAISHAPASDPKRLTDQEDAYYNLGNALYRAGQKTEKTQPDQTLKTWTDAVKAYETALQLRADDADSKFNRDLVKRKIEALEQNQNQNPSSGQGSGQGAPQGAPQRPGQAPPPPGSAHGSPPGAAPPPQAPPGQPPPAQSPPAQPQNAPPPPAQPPPAQPPPAQPQHAQSPPPAPPSNAGDPNAAEPPPAGTGAADPAAAADGRRESGEMSPEEARELLDSVKGDERHALGAPLARRDADQPPEKPFKNW